MRNVRTIAAGPVTTLADGDFVYALPASTGNLIAITVANLKIVLGAPTTSAGDPNGSLDGPPGRTAYDTTAGSERIWVKTTALGILTGWK